MQITNLPTWLSAAKTISNIQSHQFRELQWESFLKLGFPHRKNVKWRYADVASIYDLPVEITPFHTLTEHHIAKINQIKKERPQHIFLIFIDGCFIAEYSDLCSLPPGIVARSVQEADFAVLKDPSKDHPYPFAFINGALYRDGLYLELADGCALSKPIVLLSFYTTVEFSQARHLIRMGTRSKLNFVMEEVILAGDLNPTVRFANDATLVYLGAHAQLHYTNMQCTDLTFHRCAHFFVTQEACSFLSYCNLMMGGRWTRDEVLIHLQGNGARCQISGYYQPLQSSQYVGQHIEVLHLAPYTQSETTYKGVIGNQATGVFSNRVHVASVAKHTVAMQNNQHLLLAPNANAYAQPELEINTDEVQCKHGAATGQLDEAALFYLRSRGLNQQQAMRLLLAGFATPIIERAESSIQNKMHDLLSKQTYESGN